MEEKEQLKEFYDDNFNEISEDEAEELDRAIDSLEEFKPKEHKQTYKEYVNEQIETEEKLKK